MSEIIFEQKLPLGNFRVYNDKPKLDNVIHVHQIHSADLIEYTGIEISHKQVDGIYILQQNLEENFHFAIKTADCIPVVFLGDKGIAIIHAGWAGVRDKILIHKNLKIIEPYFCFLGPSIQLRAFEVKDDFFQHFAKSPNYHNIEGKLHFDLQSEAIQQIQSVFPNIEIKNSQECTFEKQKYNSYRRDKTKRRNWNIFSI